MTTTTLELNLAEGLALALALDDWLELHHLNPDRPAYYGAVGVVRDRLGGDLIAAAPDDACTGCGRRDPMGTHFEHCTLKMPGDLLLARNGRVIGYVEGPEEAE